MNDYKEKINELELTLENKKQTINDILLKRVIIVIYINYCYINKLLYIYKL